MKKILLSIAAVLAFGVSQGQVLLSENFDVFPVTWSQTNQSSPLGEATWIQGGGTAFDPGGQAGGATSFTLVNYTSTTGAGTISNWLITPVVNLANGDVITFYSRTGGTGTSSPFADRLELRLNSTDMTASGVPSGGSTGVGAFTTLALTINPDLTTTGYPLTWTQYSYTVSGLTGTVACKIGFRYFVTSGGPTGDNSNIIGVDTFSVERPLSTEDFFKTNFAVYPNPANDVINISNVNQLEITNAVITDINGRIVKNIQSVTQNINISSLNAGIYFLKISTASGDGVTKIVKN
jgi:hypothetical protein